MLEKTQVLPIGSVVSVFFPCDNGRETTAVIIGHLTLRKDRQCQYDYACVEYPSGLEEGVFYINAPDIAKVIYRADDPERKHEKWMERKYAEYMVYYSQYQPTLRTSPDLIRSKTKNAGAALRHMRRNRLVKRWVCALMILIGTVLTALITKSWETAAGAVLFSLVGWFAEV